MENRIKELRECRNISQKELANVLNTTQQAISLYESGKREPKLKVWQKLGDFFNVSVPYLQGFNGHKPNRLKELRDKRGISQSQFVQAFNRLLINKKIKPITIPTYSRWENSLNSPTEKVWQQLADYFEVSVPYVKGEIDREYLKKLVELTMFFCFPKVTITYGKEEVDDEFKPFIIIEILSQMLSLLGYYSKDKFLEMYNRVIKLVDDTETTEYLQDFKSVVIQILPKAKGITKNLLNAYDNL